MKISLNWVRQYTDVKLKTDELVEKIGAQLGAVEEVIDLAPKYKGIVIAKVVECIKHPNADKLSLCKIDDGKKTRGVKRDENGLIQVVCGAPNVREDMLVAWIPPGNTVPSTFDKEPFVLEAREIRGKVSNGMLASGHELAISEDHSGILEIKNAEIPNSKFQIPKPGDDFAEAFGLNDTIIDIENKMFTHRPDCFGILGVARELAGITGKQFTSPKWYLAPKSQQNAKGKMQNELGLRVSNKIPKLVPRFMAQVVENVHVGQSEVWMQTYLSRVGIRPINNIVDITNYYMYLTGQPLHAYDADKLRQVSNSKSQILSMETRLSKKGDELKLLNGKTIKFEDEETILITSWDLPVGIGGVMGGADTEVDENTKNIVFECANFDMYAIRRSSMRHGLFTDAVTRFNKGQSPLQNDRVLAKAVEETIHQAGGLPAQTVHDEGADLKHYPSVRVSPEFINSRLGIKLTVTQITKLLENVEFKVLKAAGKQLAITPPFWRTDIEIPEDVVEEVGRLYGYDHLPLELPKRDLTPAKHDELLSFKSSLRKILAKAGANELLTYNFVHGDLLDKVGQSKTNAYKLNNAISPDLQYYRPSLVPSLLTHVHPNIKAGHGKFALFEINKSHGKDLTDKDGLPIEEERLGLVFAVDEKQANEFEGAPFYQAKNYLTTLFDTLGINAVYESAEGREPKMQIGKDAIAPFDPERAAYIRTTDGKLFGELGEFKPAVRRALKLPAYSAGFELDVLRLMEYASQSTGYTQIPRFPKVEQDITLKVTDKIPYSELAALVTKELMQKVDGAKLQVKPLAIYQKEATNHKNVTFRISVASYDRTLNDDYLKNILDEVAARAHDSFGAERI